MLSNEAMRRGMLLYVAGHHLSVAAFLPPLTASKEELRTASALLRETIEACLPA
jgi:4-aminobutyrate aminotransferase-like enzyme